MKQNNTHSVFIVDDDTDDRESIREAFLQNDHHQDYTFMGSGDQLITHLTESTNKKTPSIILLDLNMPGKDGTEVLKVLKNDENLKSIPVIVITTSASPKDRSISYQLGANCFLTKPDSYQELLAITDSIARLWLYQ